MLSYPIKGVRDGTLQAKRDGLYWEICAECSCDWTFPIRLLAETDGVRVTLGVPMPEAGRLRLQTRLSDRSCHFTEQTCILTDQYTQPPAQPEPLEPFEPEQPFEHISDFSVMHVVEQDGKAYWKPQENTAP